MAYRPQVLVVNWGLHMLFRPRVQLCNIYQWVHYERLFLERTLQVAHDAGTKVVLFKTTNRICKNQARMRDKHASLCNSTIYRWRDRARADGYKYSQLTNAELDQYYQNSILLESSSVALNQRLEAFVASLYQNNRSTQEDDMTIAIYNDHDMESCAYTPGDDGLHYKSLQMPRIQLLALMIQCLWTS